MSGHREPLESHLKGRHIVPGGRSRIARDAELRTEIEGMVRQPTTLKEMRRRLVAVFGENRAPSNTALARYVRQRRLALGFRPGGVRIAPPPGAE